MIGYHYVILPDGRLENGRPLFYEGAHVRGHNHESIGICLVGGRDKNGKPVDPRTPEQCLTLVDLLRELKQWHFPHAQIVGHRDLDRGKECPCFDAKCYNRLF